MGTRGHEVLHCCCTAVACPLPSAETTPALICQSQQNDIIAECVVVVVVEACLHDCYSIVILFMPLGSSSSHHHFITACRHSCVSRMLCISWPCFRFLVWSAEWIPASFCRVLITCTISCMNSCLWDGRWPPRINGLPKSKELG